MEVEGILAKIEDFIDDHSMPKRIKSALSQIRGDLKKGLGERDVIVTSAIYNLEEITNDVNISMHVKTAIWDIISDLESLKE